MSDRTPELRGDALLRAAAWRLRDRDAAQAAERATAQLADWFDNAANRLAQEVPSWRARIDAGQARRSVEELTELVFGPALAAATSVLSGPLPAATGNELRAIADRDAEIARLREALTTVRASLRDGHAQESILATIGRALDDPDAPRFINAKTRSKLRRAEACGKAVYLSRAEAEEAVETVWERHGHTQRPYRCSGCFLWHLTSKPLRGQGEPVELAEEAS